MAYAGVAGYVDVVVEVDEGIVVRRVISGDGQDRKKKSEECRLASRGTKEALLGRGRMPWRGIYDGRRHGPMHLFWIITALFECSFCQDGRWMGPRRATCLPCCEGIRGAASLRRQNFPRRGLYRPGRGRHSPCS